MIDKAVYLETEGLDLVACSDSVDDQATYVSPHFFPLAYVLIPASHTMRLQSPVLDRACLKALYIQYIWYPPCVE